jgi:putative oxidoreductase
MKYVLVASRILFSVIFLISASGHFDPNTIAFAASKGVPLASITVPLAGIIEAAGALSIMIGFKARYGALLIIIFLIPVTIAFHDFWNVADPMARNLDMTSFLKNISMLGGALFITYFGSGPASVDVLAQKTHAPKLAHQQS